MNDAERLRHDPAMRVEARARLRAKGIDIGIVLVPISIGGWGLRELAVVSLLATHGVAVERALLFSVCFGLALAIGSLPGALAWLLYPFAPARPSAERAG